jgi:hypothetical protein
LFLTIILLPVLAVSSLAAIEATSRRSNAGSGLCL